MSSSRPNRPLTVAFDVGPLHGPLTGIGRAVAGMRVGLDERRVVSGDDSPDMAPVRLVPYVLSYRAALGTGVTRLPYPAALAIRSWGSIPLPRPDRYLERGAHGRIDVVHGTNYVVPPSRHPTIVSVYDCWALDNPGAASPMVNRAMKALRRAVSRGAIVHASSNATAEACRRHFGDCDIEVIHLGGPVRHVHSPDHISTLPIANHEPLTRGVPFVLSVGTLERRKNLPHLVRAFAAADLGDTLLVLAGGPGDDEQAVTDCINSLHPSDRERVVLTGRVDDASLHWLYSNAKVVAYPSLDEGFGFPVLEAMAYGVPVVASRVGSIPEVAGEAAVLVPVDDLDALASALESTLADRALRDTLISEGSRRTDLFTWSATVEGLVRLYARAANSR